MRELFYRVTAAQVWGTPEGLRWEAHLLIRGQGKVIRGLIQSMKEFPGVLKAGIAAAYLKITGEPLPEPDGQLPLL